MQYLKKISEVLAKIYRNNINPDMSIKLDDSKYKVSSMSTSEKVNMNIKSRGVSPSIEQINAKKLFMKKVEEVSSEYDIDKGHYIDKAPFFICPEKVKSKVPKLDFYYLDSGGKIKKYQDNRLCISKGKNKPVSTASLKPKASKYHDQKLR